MSLSARDNIATKRVSVAIMPYVTYMILIREIPSAATEVLLRSELVYVVVYFTAT